MDDFRKRVDMSGILEILRNALPEDQKEAFNKIAEEKIKHWERIYTDMNNVLTSPPPAGDEHADQPEGQSGSDSEPTQGG